MFRYLTSFCLFLFLGMDFWLSLNFKQFAKLGIPLGLRSSRLPSTNRFFLIIKLLQSFQQHLPLQLDIVDVDLIAILPSHLSEVMVLNPLLFLFSSGEGAYGVDLSFFWVVLLGEVHEVVVLWVILVIETLHLNVSLIIIPTQELILTRDSRSA